MKALLKILVILLASQSFAQLAWEPLNLPKVNFPSILLGPDGEVYVTKEYNTQIVYRSFDDGATWDSIALPFKTGYSKPITTVDSTSIVYGMSGDTLWYSTDYGASWEFRLLPDKYNSGQYLLASKDSLFLFTSGGPGPWVFVSSDWGQSWSEKRIFSNGADMNWQGCQMSPRGSVFGFLSHDGTVRVVGGNASPRTLGPMGLRMFDQTGFGYGIRSGFDGTPVYLVRSSDEGLTWIPIDSLSNGGEYPPTWGPYAALKSGGILAVNDNTTLVSYNYASTWAVIGIGIDSLRFPTFSTSRRGTIFVAAEGKLYRTTHFAGVKKKQTIHASPYSIAFDPFTNELRISSPFVNADDKLIVINIVGKEILRRSADLDMLDLSDLCSGTYTAFIITKNARTSLTFSLYK